MNAQGATAEARAGTAAGSLPDPAEFAQRCGRDEELAELATHATVSFALTSDGEWAYSFRFTDGTVAVEQARAADADFSIHLPVDAWADLVSATPTPGRQSVLAYLRPGEPGVLDGSDESFAQHVQLVRRVIELARPQAGETQHDAPPVAAIDATGIAGSYVHVTVEGIGPCDVFVERAGTGTPLVLLATAGSDTRQFHGLMGDPALTSRYELIAVDLPWHGKSRPVTGSRGGSYTLTSQTYVGVVVAVITALGLDRPIVMGSSMAGAAVVEIAARAPSSVRGVIGAQVGPRVANRRTPWLRHPRVNQTLHVAEWTYGLMSPTSPKAYRDQVWWSYSQGGYGAYDADIGYYTASWDVDNVRELLDGSVPVVLLSGAYDYSVPPSATRELHEQVPGSMFREMPELGHFPHAENPPVFRDYLLWAAEQIEHAAPGSGKEGA